MGYENPGGGGTPYDGLYREAPPERGMFFRQSRKRFIFVIDSCIKDSAFTVVKRDAKF